MKVQGLVDYGMPTLHPMLNSRQNVVKDVFFLHFRNGVRVYYSYEHVIAFYGQSIFYIRSNFWSRRRGLRIEHTYQINTHVIKYHRQCLSAPNTTPIINGLADGEFFAKLSEVIDAQSKAIKNESFGEVSLGKRKIKV